MFKKFDPPAYEGHDLIDANLVLEGGAMRGMFTAGVLDFFMDEGVFFNRAIGVSAGALNAYNYVGGLTGRTCMLNIKYCDDPRYLSMRSYVLTGNVYGREFSFDEIPNKLDPLNYDAVTNSPVELVIVTSNLETGEAEYHVSQDAQESIPYLIASSAMPGVSKTVEINGKLYLDGGTCDSIPIVYSQLTGAKKHVVVLTQGPDYIKSPNRLMALLRQKYEDYPYFLDRLQYRHYEYNRTRRALKRMHENGEAFVIMPPEEVTVHDLESDPHKLMALYEQGVREAAEQWPALKAYLES